MTDTSRPNVRSWLDDEPPDSPTLAKAYWCEMDFFNAHVAYGGYPPCQCPEGMGHNDPHFEEMKDAL